MERCIICNRNVDDWVSNPEHADKHICIECTNGIILNLNTVKKELEPIYLALEKAVDTIGRELEKADKKSKKK